MVEVVDDFGPDAVYVGHGTALTLYLAHVIRWLHSVIVLTLRSGASITVMASAIGSMIGETKGRAVEGVLLPLVNHLRPDVSETR